MSKQSNNAYSTNPLLKNLKPSTASKSGSNNRYFGSETRTVSMAPVEIPDSPDRQIDGSFMSKKRVFTTTKISSFHPQSMRSSGDSTGYLGPEIRRPQPQGKIKPLQNSNDQTNISKQTSEKNGAQKTVPQQFRDAKVKYISDKLTEFKLSPRVNTRENSDPDENKIYTSNWKSKSQPTDSHQSARPITAKKNPFAIHDGNKQSLPAENKPIAVSRRTLERMIEEPQKVEPFSSDQSSAKACDIAPADKINVPISSAPSQQESSMCEFTVSNCRLQTKANSTPGDKLWSRTEDENDSIFPVTDIAPDLSAVAASDLTKWSKLASSSAVAFRSACASSTASAAPAAAPTAVDVDLSVAPMSVADAGSSAISARPGRVLRAGEVSDNFVRRNLKKRFKGRYKGGPPAAGAGGSRSSRHNSLDSIHPADEDDEYDRFEHDGADSFAGGSTSGRASEVDNFDEAAMVGDVGHATRIQKGKERERERAHAAAGGNKSKGELELERSLARMAGMDPIQLAIESLQSLQSQSATGVGKSSAAESGTGTGRCAERNHKRGIESLQDFSRGSLGPTIRAVGAPGARATASGPWGAIPPAVVPRGLTATKPSGARVTSKAKQNKRYGGFDDAALQECAPNCAGHDMAAKLLVVKKVGQNKGRKFYGCTFPAEQRCEFFMWAEVRQ